MHGTGTILVVDDESLLLTMADAILSEFGYNVLTASSGQKALQILAQPATRVHLVITDLVMPGMGGRELMERIRQQGLEMPVLTMSGYVLPEDKQDPGRLSAKAVHEHGAAAQGESGAGPRNG